MRSIHPQADDNLVEIGPGLGALTEELLAVNPRLQVVELDRDLVPVLRTKFFNYPDFRIHEADALKFDFSELADNGPLRIVGNLPYNISTPLIFHLLEQAGVVKDMHFMLQKEVVQRLAAGPTRAIANTKALLSASLGNTLETQLASEAVHFADCAASEDWAEGVTAFAEKRTPVFQGK